MSEKKTIWLATANEGKVKEFKSILKDYDVKTLADLDQKLDIVEDGKSFEENALIKAKKLAELVNAPAIGDDSGLEITKMDNWPGIYSKRWALPVTDFKEINNMLLDKMNEKGLTRKEDRGADFVTVIAYYDPENKKQEFFNGKVYGTIVDKPMGDNGFGYDPIFIPNGYDKTYAQMTNEEKNKFSHREIAISEFKKFLELNSKLGTSHRRINVVLYEPEIAQNTAAIMRTCVAFGARLHIIEPLGFILNEHNMSRASANEYKKVEMFRYDNWEDFKNQHPNTPLYCLSRYGQKAPSDFDFTKIDDDVYLMFGKESTGIPKDILYDNFDTTFRLPMTPQTRSINLANTVGITVCEVLRQWDWLDLAKTEVQRGADYIMSRRWEKDN